MAKDITIERKDFGENEWGYSVSASGLGYNKTFSVRSLDGHWLIIGEEPHGVEDLANKDIADRRAYQLAKDLAERVSQLEGYNLVDRTQSKKPSSSAQR